MRSDYKLQFYAYMCLGTQVYVDDNIYLHLQL